MKTKKKIKLKKYPNGGQNPPIYTSDPNDPRLLAYRDSLNLYNLSNKIKDGLIWGENAADALKDLNIAESKSNVKPTGYRKVNFRARGEDNNFLDGWEVSTYKKPVQPIIYKDNLPVEVEKMTSNHINSTPINNTINPIPFEPNTYFTRERQGQELGQGKTDYFDKKTGKLLGTYENGGIMKKGKCKECGGKVSKKAFGGLSIAPLLGKKNQDNMGFNSLGISNTLGGNNHQMFDINESLGAPNFNDPAAMTKWLSQTSNPNAKSNFLAQYPLKHPIGSALLNSAGVSPEQFANSFSSMGMFEDGGMPLKRYDGVSGANTVQVAQNPYWDYNSFAPNQMSQAPQVDNFQIADYQQGYETAPELQNSFTPNPQQPSIPQGKPDLQQGSGYAKQVFNLGKGIANFIGNSKYNKGTFNYETNQLYNQLDGAMRRPYLHSYTDDIHGQMENPMQAKDGKWISKAINKKHIGFCSPMTKSTCTPRRKALAETFKKHHGFHKKENGGNVDDYATGFNPNIEAEKGEFVKMPHGLAGTIDSGDVHSQGGTPMNLPVDSMIFSEKLKHPETKKSYSKMAKKFNTEKDFEKLKDIRLADDIAKKTAQLNIVKKNQELNNLFLEQEQNKLEGLHGQEAMNNTLQDYMELGGLKKYDGESGSNLVNGSIPPPNSYKSPEEIHRDLYNLGYRGKTDIGELQKWVSNNPKYRERILNYLRTVPITNKGFKLYGKKGDLYIDPNTGKKYNPLGKNYSDEQLLNAFQDALYDYRFANFGDEAALKEGIIQTPQPIADTPNTDIPYKMNLGKAGKNRRSNLNFTTIPIPLLSNYAEEPLTNVQVNPNLVNYRPIDIEPNLNEIARNQKSLSRKLGTRPTDISAKAQLQANSLNAINQAFGNKFNLEQQGKMNVDQTNANILNTTGLQNAELTKGFLDMIQRRKGALDTQMRTDAAQALENEYLMNNYYNTADYIQNTFNPFSQEVAPIGSYLPKREKGGMVKKKTIKVKKKSKK